MKFIFSLLAFITFNSHANLHLAPPNFQLKDGKEAVWIDILQANYNIVYDYKKKSNTVRTTFSFLANGGRGFPLFDLVNKPQAVFLNHELVEHELIKVPGNVSVMRVAKGEVKPGINTLEIYSEITKEIKYTHRGISNGFFIKDLKQRLFLERYVPANYEYDQYPMNFHVKINNTSIYHNIFANGEVEEISPQEFKVSYPAHYTASSVFFHLVPLRKFKRLYFNYTSITGREIPVTIYSSLWILNYKMKDKALKVLAELENDYGPYVHPEVLIYGTGLKGGMEYVGATATSLVSLGHELHHMYFAKGVMPANGNSGWMDEAIASWRDKGYQSNALPFYASKNLGNHSIYQRQTDSDSYKYGRSFMGYLDHQLKSVGLPGLKDFLRTHFNARKFTNITTEDFILDLNNYSGMDFNKDFDQYIFGHGGGKTIKQSFEESEESIHHPDYTEEEINSII